MGDHASGAGSGLPGIVRETHDRVRGWRSRLRGTIWAIHPFAWWDLTCRKCRKSWSNVYGTTKVVGEWLSVRGPEVTRHGCSWGPRNIPEWDPDIDPEPTTGGQSTGSGEEPTSPYCAIRLQGTPV